MSSLIDITPNSDRELAFGRLLDAPRAKVFRAWTDPALVRQWFAPLPFVTTEATLDVRPGGSSHIVMRGPDGTEFPSRGVYLDVVEDERLVFTDAFTDGWSPSQKPFMVVELTFGEAGEQTRYVVRVKHWSVADREAHEAMGFYQGWSLCADQLEAVAAALP